MMKGKCINFRLLVFGCFVSFIGTKMVCMESKVITEKEVIIEAMENKFAQKSLIDKINIWVNDYEKNNCLVVFTLVI